MEGSVLLLNKSVIFKLSKKETIDFPKFEDKRVYIKNKKIYKDKGIIRM